MTVFLTCPNCGRRSGYEFRFGGEDKGPRPEEETLDPVRWCDWAHNSTCTAGVQREWWVHRAGCGAWFTVWRDTRTNRQVPEPRPEEDRP